ncbi:tRNA pseudouridine(55) synthase TruB [Lyngbya confervoides]|uniref:tRNA pseudouridine synthase B n=1 Tax=Lyngbya confervoides BDU141951 TaxID=1574623 RepID=A0ABD4T7S1_9CYAN|nr:tRNA pseudouridine(55) synthase TruB [Lyngbya confervoides]MCM1984569.1 tRNA pseudouridine(55) synthase TruB [Lyngbya confervoides BDU141951]
MRPGFINLNKPAGLTSHDCVSRLRRLLQCKRVGHGGTLDPAATGVLPMALGPATRLLPYLPGEKSYRAIIHLGLHTDTDDLTGQILGRQSAVGVQRHQIEALLPGFLGDIDQIPPRYSAIQIDGQRQYALARQGKSVTIAPRPVHIQTLDILDWQAGEVAQLVLAITCGPGTYIRAIARDLGTALGVGGTLAQLIRTHSGGFDLSGSHTLDTLAQQVQQEQFQPIEIPTALSHLPSLKLDPVWTQRWCFGQRLPLESLAAAEAPYPVLVLTQQQQPLGIGRYFEGVLSPRVVLPPP